MKDEDVQEIVSALFNGFNDLAYIESDREVRRATTKLYEGFERSIHEAWDKGFEEGAEHCTITLN